MVPIVSIAVRKSGQYLRELSRRTQAAAAVATSIAEVGWSLYLYLFSPHEPFYGQTSATMTMNFVLFVRGAYIFVIPRAVTVSAAKLLLAFLLLPKKKNCLSTVKIS